MTSRLAEQVSSLACRDCSAEWRKQLAASGPKIVATGYRRPSLNLLKPQKTAQPSADTSPSVLQGRARMLEDVLAISASKARSGMSGRARDHAV